MSKLMQLVSIAALNLKAGTQFREKMDEDAVKDYTQRLKEWADQNTTGPDPADATKRVKLTRIAPMTEWTKCPLPAITVFETETDGTINADGFHRVKASKAAGLEMFPAEVKKGTKEDAVRFALAANAHHGVRLSQADKHNKLKAALKFPDFKELSNNALAVKLGVSEFFVRTNRPAGAVPKVVKTASGKTMDTSNTGKKGGNTAKKKAAAKKAAKAKKGDKGEAAAGASTEGQQSEEEKALAGALGGDTGTPATGDAGAATGKKFDEDTEKALARIVKTVHDGGIADGPTLDASIRNGTVEISTADVRFLGGLAPERIALTYPLVFGEKRMKPKAALAFIDQIPDANMKLGHLLNMTVARRGMVVERVENVASDPESGFHVIIIPAKGFEVLRNVSLGSVFAVSKANKDAALAAIKEA